MIAGMPVHRFVTTILLAGEFTGLVVFVVMYARRGQWRGSPVGQTLLLWPVTMAVLMAVSIAVRVWPSTVMSWTLTAAHAAFLVAVWQKVRVLARYLRDDERTPDEEDPQGSDGGGRRRRGGGVDRPAG